MYPYPTNDAAVNERQRTGVEVLREQVVVVLADRVEQPVHTNMNISIRSPISLRISCPRPKARPRTRQERDEKKKTREETPRTAHKRPHPQTGPPQPH